MATNSRPLLWLAQPHDPAPRPRALPSSAWVLKSYRSRLEHLKVYLASPGTYEAMPSLQAMKSLSWGLGPVLLALNELVLKDVYWVES